MGLDWEIYSISAERAQMIVANPGVLEACLWPQERSWLKEVPMDQTSALDIYWQKWHKYRNEREMAQLFRLTGGPIEEDEFETFNEWGGRWHFVGRLEDLAGFGIGRHSDDAEEARIVQRLLHTEIRECLFLTPPHVVADLAAIARQFPADHPPDADELRAYQRTSSWYRGAGSDNEEEIESLLGCVREFVRYRDYLLRHAARGRAILVDWGY